MTNKIPIGIIEDDAQIRQEFQQYFSGKSSLECVFTASSVEKFEKYFTPSLNLRILMLDIHLPGISGLDAIEGLKKQLADDAEVIIYTSYQEPNDIFKALCSGATGYLLKNESMATIERQLQQVVDEGGGALSPAIARRIVQFFNPTQPILDENKLKPIERQVVHYLMDGKTYEEIAQLMSLSVSGVKYHQKSIFRKLNISSRKQLNKWT